LTGIDAARGVALIGLLSVHLLPAHDPGTQESTWSSLFFSGDAAALFVLLAGVGLALDAGGRFPHEGRWLAADRAGVAVRAVLIAVVGLGAGALVPEDAPGDNLLMCYGVILLLALPFLRLSAPVLFLGAAVLWIEGPLLMQSLTDVVGEPAGTVAQVLLTGAHPALPSMTYLLVGLGLGRLRLRDTGIQLRLLAVGAGLVAFALTTSSFVLHPLGGYGSLPGTGGMSRHELGEALVWGTDPWPTDSSAWPAAAARLGAGLLVLGSLLLASGKWGAGLRWLSAMGAMTLTLYTAHLVALSFAVPDDLPWIRFTVHLGTAALFALAWHRTLGQGPLERVVGTSVTAARRTVLQRAQRLPRQ